MKILQTFVKTNIRSSTFYNENRCIFIFILLLPPHSAFILLIPFIYCFIFSPMKRCANLNDKH